MNGAPRMGCGWFARRLPLLAGGELAGLERRRVERHLLACSDCRARHAGLTGALGVLRAAAGAGAGEASRGGSLWPALRRQIQEERHAPGRSRPVGLGLGSWLDGLSGWFASRSRSRVLAAAAAVVVLAGLAAVGIELWVQRRVDTLLAEARRPIDAPASVSASALAMASRAPAAPAVVSVPEAAWESPSPPVVAAVKPDRLAPVDYDLDAGTLMGPDAHERTAKASY